MPYECVSADAAAVRVRDLHGYGWSFGLVERDGMRDLAPDDVEEYAEGLRPASFTRLAGAYLFALKEARRRGLIDP